MIETGISIVALVLILANAWKGWRLGLFRAGARWLFTVLAVLISLRYWQPYSAWLADRLTMPQDQMAFAGFWCLFALLFVPPDALLRSLNEEFVPVYPAPLERVGGLICGALTALLISAAVFLSVLPMFPKYFPSYDPSRMLLPLDRLPLALYGGLEKQVTRQSAGGTRLPMWKVTLGQAGQVEWR